MIELKTFEALDRALKQNQLVQTAYDNISLWLSKKEYRQFQPKIVKLIEKDDWQKLNDSFYTTLPFGTGGRRGPRGLGPNRINERTIGESAQGLANYLVRQGEPARRRGVAIAYDTRIQSKQFARLSAEIFAGNEIKTFIYDGPRSTPQLSFTVRYLKTQAGVVISASHNPPSDNGFKVYMETGGQIVPPKDQELTDQVRLVSTIKKISYSQAIKIGLISQIGPSIDQAYLDQTSRITLRPTRSASIVFSPLHGTGSTNILKALELQGYRVETVNQQMSYDGRFPSCPGGLPNPELNQVFSRVIRQAKKSRADLALVSDPDADRVGIALADQNQVWRIITGNQVGSLCLEYLARTLNQLRLEPPSGVVLETVVTSRLIGDIGRAWGYQVVDDLLVGFKYLADQLENFSGSQELVFGSEESLGYWRADFVRDKDGAQGALVIAEAASWLKDQGKTLFDLLDELYLQHGYYQEILAAALLDRTQGQGQAQINRIMSKLRLDRPAKIAGLKVHKIIDRSIGQPPHDNLLIFYLSQDGRNRLSIRPSGTEPKIKFYVSCHDRPAGKELSKTKKVVNARAQKIAAWAKALVK